MIMAVANLVLPSLILWSPLDKIHGLLSWMPCMLLSKGGPSWNLEYMKPLNSILVATDPVAIDRVMLELIDGLRKEANMTAEAQRVRFLDFANELGLGESDLSKIDLIEINLG